MSKSKEAINKTIYQHQEIKTSCDLDQVNEHTSDTLTTPSDIITKETGITYFETDIIADIVKKGWFAVLRMILDYDDVDKVPETTVIDNQKEFNDPKLNNLSLESSNFKTDDIENSVDYENNLLEAKTEYTIYKGYFTQFLEILTFSSSRVEADKKLVEMSEVKSLPNEEQVEIKQISSESLHQNFTPEKTMQKMQQIGGPEIIGNNSILTIEE